MPYLRALMADVGAYLAAGAVLPGGMHVPPVAPLDTGELRSQILENHAYRPTHSAGGRDSRQQRRSKYAKAERQAEKRKYHGALVDLLVRMDAGEFGWSGGALADKWLEEVKRCPGGVRRHGVCLQDSFCPRSCFFGLCPWCQARTAKHRAHRIEPIVSAFASPKLWTFTGGPNQEELTGAGISAVQAAVVSLHRRVYIKKRCRGGFRKVEVTNTGNGWNIHCHELADAEYVPIWPVSDIAWPAKPFTPYTARDKYAKPVKHPGLAVLFTEACQKSPELRADGVRWKGWPVFAKDNPESWFMVDVRVANCSPENEISKYICKGNDIVMAGGRAVLDYMQAIKGKQLFKGFGHCYNVDLESANEEDEAPEPEMKGCCPYDDWPMPNYEEWEYRYMGFPDAGQWELERNPKTGTYRLIPVGQGDG